MRCKLDFTFDPSLVLYLPLSELDGGSFRSRDAYGHLCTVTGASWRPDGMYFDGTDDNVDITNALSALASNTEGTILIWFSPVDASPTPDNKIIAFGDSDSQEFIYLSLKTTSILESACKVGGASRWLLVMDSAAFSDKNFYFIGLVQDSTQAKIYVDGIPPSQTFEIITDKTAWFSDATGIDNGFIGKLSYSGNPSQGPFNGTIGDVLIYNRALPPQEIQNIYLTTRWRYQ